MICCLQPPPPPLTVLPSLPASTPPSFFTSHIHRFPYTSLSNNPPPLFLLNHKYLTIYSSMFTSQISPPTSLVVPPSLPLQPPSPLPIAYCLHSLLQFPAFLGMKPKAGKDETVYQTINIILSHTSLVTVLIGVVAKCVP